jgi:type IV pilus assembly protein PilW
VIQVQLGAGNWQALTDANSLEVTSFEILPTVTSVSIPGVCAPTPSGSSPCAAADPACVPYHQVRRIAVSISARGMDDRRVTRQLRNQVRLRNDVLVNPCGV